MKNILLLFCFVPLLNYAQNLVPNPGFETQTSCPAVSEITKAPPWNSPSIGTPDVTNSSCPQQNSSGRTGIGSAGVFVVSSFPDSREYIQARLTSPLQAGNTYCVEFYVKRANFKYASDRIGAYFSYDSIYLNQTDPLPYVPQIANPLGNFIRSTSTWTKISGSFTASGGEAFIIIGNFYGDANTVKDSVGTGSNVGYYKIDDISVTACVTGINDLADINTRIYPNPANDRLYFETDMNTESIKIYSVGGQLIEEQLSPGYKYEFNTANYANGLYVMHIATTNSIVYKRFSVSH